MLEQSSSFVSVAPEDDLVVELSVERFPSVKPKFTVEDWESGEGGESDGTGESEVRPDSPPPI